MADIITRPLSNTGKNTRGAALLELAIIADKTRHVFVTILQWMRRRLPTCYGDVNTPGPPQGVCGTHALGERFLAGDCCTVAEEAAGDPRWRLTGRDGSRTSAGDQTCRRTLVSPGTTMAAFGRQP
jgi:hypothetical protein